MKGLSAVPGMIEALREKVLKEGAPFLGICVGMQLMATVGVEFGRHAGLGWIAGEVVKITPTIQPENPAYGLERNSRSTGPCRVDGIAPGSHAYFVHSFQLKPVLPTT
jgi:glutamine amidotransferase